MPLSPEQFVEKYARVELPERSVRQDHFLDLCRLIDHPTSIHELWALRHGARHGFGDDR